MAGLGYRSFTPGEILTASNLQGYAVDQSVMKFATTAARTTALPTPSQGMMSWIDATGSVEVYYEAYSVSNTGGALTAGWYPLPGASMFYGTASRSAATGTTYTVGAASYLYTEYIDPYNWHSAVTNTDRITPNLAGVYRLTANVNFAANASGGRTIYFRKNAIEIARVTSNATSALSQNPTGSLVIAMNGSTDYFTVDITQDSGSSLTAGAQVAVEFLRPTQV